MNIKYLKIYKYLCFIKIYSKNVISTIQTMLLVNIHTKFTKHLILLIISLFFLSFSWSAALLGRLRLFFYRRIATLSWGRFLSPTWGFTFTRILCFLLQVLLLPLFIRSLPTICTESYALKERTWFESCE